MKATQFLLAAAIVMLTVVFSGLADGTITAEQAKLLHPPRRPPLP